ncbi:hypothetical protein KIL84_015325 [Mauremys mutica]|uniref:Uncharacterized protein n=1 Tax=Mauremys mutica TaxID=74926 RepID=A0A9D4APP9_9SAUR|nr:hypothetical protein KIL84_015325 [Mauremys mutica]
MQSTWISYKIPQSRKVSSEDTFQTQFRLSLMLEWSLERKTSGYILSSLSIVGKKRSHRICSSVEVCRLSPSDQKGLGLSQVPPFLHITPDLHYSNEITVRPIVLKLHQKLFFFCHCLFWC